MNIIFMPFFFFFTKNPNQFVHKTPFLHFFKAELLFVFSNSADMTKFENPVYRSCLLFCRILGWKGPQGASRPSPYKGAELFILKQSQTDANTTSSWQPPVKEILIASSRSLSHCPILAVWKIPVFPLPLPSHLKFNRKMLCCHLNSLKLI